MSERESARDTQFAGFAKLLWEQLETSIQAEFGFYPEGKKLRTRFLTQTRRVIARRAYDLVEHVLSEQIAIGNIEQGTIEGIQPTAPDLTKWPEEEEHHL